MLAELQLDDFSQHVGSDFELQSSDGAIITARLAEAVALTDHHPNRPAGTRRPFSLIFLASTQPLLPQGIHRVTHAVMPELSYFLVPIGPDAEGRMRYQAIFN